MKPRNLCTSVLFFFFSGDRPQRKCLRIPSPRRDGLGYVGLAPTKTPDATYCPLPRVKRTRLLGLPYPIGLRLRVEFRLVPLAPNRDRARFRAWHSFNQHPTEHWTQAPFFFPAAREGIARELAPNKAIGKLSGSSFETRTRDTRIRVE